MIAALVRIFGVHNIPLAEDVVQEAFCRALEVWKFRGVPENPSAWLMATAKNRALDVLRRQRTANVFAPELGRLLQSEWTLAPVVEELFSATAVKDDMLRVMFSCCHPRLSEEAQVALRRMLKHGPCSGMTRCSRHAISGVGPNPIGIGLSVRNSRVAIIKSLLSLKEQYGIFSANRNQL